MMLGGRGGGGGRSRVRGRVAPLVGAHRLAAALAEHDEEVDEARQPRLLAQQVDEALHRPVVDLLEELLVVGEDLG